MGKLKSCPFCGGGRIRTFGPTHEVDDKYDPADRSFPIAVCRECYGQASGDNDDRSWDHSSAIAAWNTRAEAPRIAELEAENAAIRKQLEEAKIDACSAVIEAIDVSSKWFPIESAPKDGTRILVYSTKNKLESYKSGPHVDRHNKTYAGGFGKFNSSYYPATHWHPLPPAPKGE